VDDFFDYFKKNPNGTVDEFLKGVNRTAYNVDLTKTTLPQV